MASLKIILAGYEGSKRILPISSWLIKKYLSDYDVYFLNYGGYDNKLHHGIYVKLDDWQKGGVESWSRYIASYLKTLPDEYVIFALDDYLVSNSLRLPDYEGYDCVNLCAGSDSDNKEYSCTTQYTIWRKECLIEALEQVKTPWEFEIEGSKYINKLGKKIKFVSVLFYPDCSCLSSKWEGILLSDSNIKDLCPDI